MRDFRRVRRKLADAKAELDVIKTREDQAKADDHWKEHERLKKFEQGQLLANEETAKAATRKGNTNVILEGVDPDQRDDVALIIAGMQAEKKINLEDTTEGAGAKLRAKLEADRPGWFKAPANASPNAPQGSPGIGAPTGTLLNLENGREVIMQMTDEQFKQRFVQNKKQGAAKL